VEESREEVVLQEMAEEKLGVMVLQYSTALKRVENQVAGPQGVLSELRTQKSRVWGKHHLLNYATAIINSCRAISRS
jgi:hypothetical protein